MSAVRFYRGFTLIELVISMMVLSILAVGSVKFIGLTADTYVDTLDRSAYSTRASIINETVSRRLRNALPNSVRVSSDQSCIEYIPIVAASTYVQAPIVGNGNAENEVTMLAINARLGDTGYGVIYPSGNSDLLYNNTRNPGRISSQVLTLQSLDNDVALYAFSGGTTFQYEQDSPQKRIYLVDRPQTLCQQGSQLFLYQDYGFVGPITNLMAMLPNQLPNRWLLADQLQPLTMRFDVVPSTLRRNGLVQFRYTLMGKNKGETLAVSHEVQIKNVP